MGFFAQTVNSDCLADKFGGKFNISTIRHRGWLSISNRWHLGRGEGTMRGLGTDPVKVDREEIFLGGGDKKQHTT